MQDRSYAIAIAVILAICCLGVYVAVSGFLNTRPPGAILNLPQAITPVSVFLPTETTAAPKPSTASAPLPTNPPEPSPIGLPLPTLALPATVTTPLIPATATTKPTSPPAILPSPPPISQNCADYVFCPSGGPPDPNLAPTGAQCPQNYVWGRVVDKSGKGIPGMRIRFKGPMNNIDSVEAKGPPDPPGIFNILAPPPGGNWVVWVLDAGGAQASPQFTVRAPQIYSGSGNCPTRVDFRAQR